MTNPKENDVSFEDIRRFLTYAIRGDNASRKGLNEIREELGVHFGKPRKFFDDHKDEINDLILETLRDIYRHKAQDVKVEAERAPNPDKRLSVPIEESPTAGVSPKKTRKLQAEVMTRKEFLETAKKLHVQIGNNEFSVPPKLFSTESCGWYASEKVRIEVNGKEFVCQVGLNCTIVGSKQWKNS